MFHPSLTYVHFILTPPPPQISESPSEIMESLTKMYSIPKDKQASSVWGGGHTHIRTLRGAGGGVPTIKDPHRHPRAPPPILSPPPRCFSSPTSAWPTASPTTRRGCRRCRHGCTPSPSSVRGGFWGGERGIWGFFGVGEGGKRVWGGGKGGFRGFGQGKRGVWGVGKGKEEGFGWERGDLGGFWGRIGGFGGCFGVRRRGFGVVVGEVEEIWGLGGEDGGDLGFGEGIRGGFGG